MAGCVNNGIETRQDFAVTVKHDGKPLAGVVVQVTSKDIERFSGTTSNDGTVHLNLTPGEYWLKAELLGISAAYESFHISERPSRQAKRKLAFEWGDYAPATRRIAGTLVDSQPGKGGTPISNLLHHVDVPIIGASLKLQSPITNAVYSTTSDHNGNFAFDLLPKGEYVLHIEGGIAGGRGYDATDLLVELSPSGRGDVLLLTRRNSGGGSCGGTSLELRNAN